MKKAPIDSAFLRGSDLFERQPEEVLQAVLVQGQVMELGSQGILFRQGEEGERLYIVKSGALEVLTSGADGTETVPVAYLGVGEVLGEVALLTGSTRTATIRAPERAELFVLERRVFWDLMDTLPSFARDLCVVLARRLDATTHKIPRTAARQLQGNLRFFDLATVIQTLIGAQQTGTLLVTQDEGAQKLAELFFFKGNIARGRVKHLTGDDAIYQLFQQPLEGNFSFTGKPAEEGDVHADITLPGISLLLEAVRLQDELALLKRKIPDPGRVFGQKAVELQWSDVDSVELAASIWARLKNGSSVAELEKVIPRCSYAIYSTVAGLIETNQIV
jgi:CRP-like cAMP-binding protein